MTELDMIKAFAELEGIELTYSCAEGLLGEGYPAYYAYEKEPDSNEFYEYNPITDLALNCAARDKYEVTVEYSGNSSFCGIGKHPGVTFVDFRDKSEVNIAVIKCILKSKGLWKKENISERFNLE